MSSQRSSPYYKVTRTVTDSDGKKYIETTEMNSGYAGNFMENTHANINHALDFSNFGSSLFDNSPNLLNIQQQKDQDNSASESQDISSGIQNPSANRDEENQNDEENQSDEEDQSDEEFVRESLEMHNKFRQRHGVGPLRLNHELSALAQQWADHLASIGTLQHWQPQYRDQKVGENIYAQSWPMTGKEMTEAWYSECQQYSYDYPSFQWSTGHFTQVVWKNSKEVGFAYAEGDSMNFAVAMYYPPGNFNGDFENNVFPPD